MATDENEKRLLSGVAAWNDWRKAQTTDSIEPDLRKTQLFDADLRGANLHRAKLDGANLDNADLREADLSAASLVYTNFCGVDFRGANLKGANFTKATLKRANLTDANIDNAIFSGANTSGIIPKSIDDFVNRSTQLDVTQATKNTAKLHTIITTTPLSHNDLIFTSLFARLPPIECRRNDFNLAATLDQSPDVDIVLPEATSFDLALKILLDGQDAEHSSALLAAVTRAIAEDYAIIGIRNPPADLGPDLLNGGFSVGSVVRMLEGGTAGQTIVAAIFIVAAGIVVLHLAKGIGRGLDKGGEKVALALCERVAEGIRRPAAEIGQTRPETQ